MNKINIRGKSKKKKIREIVSKHPLIEEKINANIRKAIIALTAGSEQQREKALNLIKEYEDKGLLPKRAHKDTKKLLNL